MNSDNILKNLSPILLALMVFAVLGVAISEVHSFDVFWQLQNGRYMAETSAFIRSDTFTLAADVPRHEHTWLHSLVLYGLYKIAGYGAISVFKGVIVTLTALFLVLAARRRESSWIAIILLLPVFLLTSSGWLERPQLWTFLFSAVFIWALESQMFKSSWRLLWLLPLMIFWSNLHAGSILAIALVFAYMVGDTGQSLLRKQFSWLGTQKLLVLVFGILLAGLVNPYPSRWFNTLLGSYRLGASVDKTGKVIGSSTAVFNMDWTPTTFQNEPLFFYLLGLSCIIVILGWRRARLADICLLIGLALMGTKLVRHIPFFYMGMVAILPAYLDAAVDPVRLRLPAIYRKISLLALCCLAVFVFWDLWQPIHKIYGTFNTGLRAWHYPIEATEFVEEHKLSKNIYNTYDWGGYMAFKLFPDYLMFWDGRQNSSEMFQLGWNVMAGKPDWEDILDKFGVNTIVTRASTIDTGQKYPLLDRLRESEHWVLVLNAESSMVFVRNGSMSKSWIRKYSRPKDLMDDTILSESHLMVRVNPNRFMAWWEMAQIYTKRRQYKEALFALEQHLKRSPRRSSAAEQLYYQLTQVTKGSRNQ
jgi:hypothetical protein